MLDETKKTTIYFVNNIIVIHNKSIENKTSSNSNFVGNITNATANILPKHLENIKQLKQEGYKVVGYCGKSNRKSDNLTSLLQQ